MSTSAESIIDDKGVEALADATSARRATVRMWKHRKRIPRTVWPEILAKFPDLTLDDLRATEDVAA